MFLLISSLSLVAQDCLYLAYESFDNPTNTALNGVLSEQTGRGNWSIQNHNNNLMGYHISTTNLMSYSDLQNEGGYATGGINNLHAGRFFDLNPDGLFGPYLNENQYVGAVDSTVWVSALLRKEQNNQQAHYMVFRKVEI